jgi:hypothetical protein
VDSVVPGKFILRDPSQEPGAGDATEVAFTVEHAFIDLDESEYPDTDSGGVTPGEPTYYVDIPAQAAAELSDALKNALLLDVFNSVPAFGSAAFTATLYNGIPGSGGIAISDTLTLTAWTTFDEPTLVYQTEARNHAAVDWTDASSAERIATHIRFARNGLTTDLTLAVPLVIPAYYGVRAPANALALSLTWPFDGTATPPAAANRPSRHFLKYFCGATRAATFATANLYCTFSDSDLVTPEDFDSIPEVAATAGNWAVSGLTVAPADIAGVNTAPPETWPIELVTVHLNGGSAICLREYYTATITEGNVVTIDGSPVLDLNEPPAP